MTFSIVIPAYNGSKFIEAAIQSALSQNRKADEILVSDDTSSDDTLEICEKYADQVKIFRHTEGPSGFVKGWNTAIAHASCDYVTILHQDDLLLHGYLGYVEETLQKHPGIKHVFSGYKTIGESDRVLQNEDGVELKISYYSGEDYTREYISEIYRGTHLHRCPGVTTERNLLLKECSYREEAGHIADDDFFFRVGNFTDVAGIDNVVACYREHPFSATSRQENLALRLAKDWIFQVEEFYQNKNVLLDQEDGYRLTELAVRDLTTALADALIKQKKDLIKEIMKLEATIQRYTGIYPGQISRSFNKRILWGLTDHRMFFSARVLSMIIQKSRTKL